MKHLSCLILLASTLFDTAQGAGEPAPPLEESVARAPFLADLLARLPAGQKAPVAASFDLKGSTLTLQAHIQPDPSKDEVHLWVAAAEKGTWSWTDRGTAPLPKGMSPELSHTVSLAVDPDVLQEGIRKLEQALGRALVLTATFDDEKHTAHYVLTLATRDGRRDVAIPLEQVLSRDARTKLTEDVEKHTAEIAKNHGTTCMNRLKMVGLAVMLYQDRVEHYPPSIEALWNARDLADPKGLLCPTTQRKPGKGFATDYAYLPPPEKLPEKSKAAWITAYDVAPTHEIEGKKWRHILFLDGHVERLEEPEFQARLKRQGPIPSD